MEREFNVTGNCNPQRCYMVDISGKLATAMQLIRKGKYFAINRPRQYGKTTMLDELERRLEGEYAPVYLSFEGVGDAIFEDEASFSPRFVGMLADSIEGADPEAAATARTLGDGVMDLETLSRFISEFIQAVQRDVVLLIDEVDKSSNSQLFVSFLAMLRQKYLLRERGKDVSFLSVILAGVHDVKSLKLRIREGDEVKLNSPWNIAADFTVDMNFSPAEIGTMLVDYAEDRGVEMDVDSIAERIHYYSSGYPFLVSKLCKNIDEEASDQNPDYDPKRWTLDDVDWSFRRLTRENYTTTNFDDLVKNLENNPKLYEMTYQVVFGTQKGGVPFSLLEPVTSLGVQYGIFAEVNGKVGIQNLVYEQIIANYMRAKSFANGEYASVDVSLDYSARGHLQLDVVLLKFQAFMQEHYSDRDERFLEREGRLLFMSFLKPIINGRGFMWKEPVVGDERSMDIVVTFGEHQKEVIELKVWRGNAYHQNGLRQLSDYLDFQGLKTGYMLIFDFSKNKQYTSEQIRFADKNIFAVRV